MAVVIPYPFYIKREDVRDFADGQKRSSSIILFLTAFIIGFMNFLVGPKVLETYSQFNLNSPFITEFSNFISIIFIAILIISGIYLLITKTNYSKVDRVAKKYRRGEMIMTRELVDYKYQLWPLFALLIGMAYLWIAFIQPIYQLTKLYSG